MASSNQTAWLVSIGAVVTTIAIVALMWVNFLLEPKSTYSPKQQTALDRLYRFAYQLYPDLNQSDAAINHTLHGCFVSILDMQRISQYDYMASKQPFMDNSEALRNSALLCLNKALSSELQNVRLADGTRLPLSEDAFIRLESQLL
jgi:hypothetical protein